VHLREFGRRPQKLFRALELGLEELRRLVAVGVPPSFDALELALGGLRDQKPHARRARSDARYSSKSISSPASPAARPSSIDRKSSARSSASISSCGSATCSR